MTENTNANGGQLKITLVKSTIESEQDGRWLIDETCAIGDGSSIQTPST